MKMNIKKIHAGNFIYNNGAVLRALNILEHRFHRLRSIAIVLKSGGVAEDELIESLNFLNDEGYVALRLIETKDTTTLADAEFDDIEAKLTARGKRVMLGGINDDMIEV